MVGIYKTSMDYLPEGAKTWILQNLPAVEELAPYVPDYYRCLEELHTDDDIETVRAKLADSIIEEDDLDKWVETLMYNPACDALPTDVLENADMIGPAVMEVYVEQILSGEWDEMIFMCTCFNNPMMCHSVKHCCICRTDSYMFCRTKINKHACVCDSSCSEKKCRGGDATSAFNNHKCICHNEVVYSINDVNAAAVPKKCLSTHHNRHGAHALKALEINSDPTTILI